MMRPGNLSNKNETNVQKSSITPIMLVEKDEISLTEFLIPDVLQRRDFIRRVSKDYTSVHDPLSEAIQNAVDEIIKGLHEKYIDFGFLEITIDAKKKIIMIKDNGGGLRSLELLKLFSTDKICDTISVGENGAGSIFLMFLTNNYQITYGNGEVMTSIKGVGLRDWINSPRIYDIKFEVDRTVSKVRGTTLTLAELEDLPIFSLSFKQLVYLLRTKTFVGCTKYLWNKEDDLSKKLKVNLTFIDKDGVEYRTLEIKPSYMLPFERNNNVLNYNEYAEKFKSISDEERRSYIRGKCITYFDVVTSSIDQRQLKVFACAVPTRDDWDELGINLGLYSKDDLKNESFIKNFGFIQLKPEIILSTKGMPTAIKIQKPQNVGASGYLDNIYIIIEDPRVSLNIGRKTIDEKLYGYAYGEYNEILIKIFNLLKREVFVHNKKVREFDFKKEVVKYRKSAKPMGLKNFPVKTQPTKSEPLLSDTFVSLLTLRVIPGVYIEEGWHTGKYDRLCSDDNDNSFIVELKCKLSQIANDFKKYIKSPLELHYIMCWGITPDDANKIRELGFELTKNITFKKSYKERVTISDSVTHNILLGTGIPPIPIIDISIIIDFYKDETNNLNTVVY